MNLSLSSSVGLPRFALRLLPGPLAVVGLLWIFRTTVAEMVDTYGRSETFAHAYLVPLISLWLVWRLRFALAGTPVKPQPLFLIPMVLACFLWLLGELAVVNAASQFALVSLLILTVPAIYGTAVARVLLFPLLFLYFAVPAGLFLLPLMMEQTADFTVRALQLSGIPVYREGLQFVIPSGSWSVVEACSGVRYLIASFMVGTLFAYLNYTSAKRRLLFIGISIAVPVVANWLRAYMIVMLGHLSSNRLAVGVDHLIYGWVFFGVVIGLMFMLGARWSQVNEPPSQAQKSAFSDAVARTSLGVRSLAVLWATAAGAVIVMMAAQLVLWSLDRPRSDPLQALKLPLSLSAEWSGGHPAFTEWAPVFKGARHTDIQVYQAVSTPASEAQRVGVWAGYYREQGPQNKLVSSNHTLSKVEETQWAQVGSEARSVTAAGQDYVFRKTLMRGPGLPGSPAAQRLLVMQIYWLGGGNYSASDVRAKLQLAINRLQGRGDDSAALIFYAPAGHTTAELEQTDALLNRFLQNHLDRFGRTLQALENRPQ